MARTSQRDLDCLAKWCHYRNGDHAAADVLGRPLRDIHRRGLTDQEGDVVIAALRDAQEGNGMGRNPGNPDRTWTIGVTALAGGAWWWAGAGVGTWLMTGFAALLCAGMVADWCSVMRDRLRFLSAHRR